MSAYKFLPFAILLVSVSSVLQWCSLPIGNTFLWWLLDALILYSMFKLKPKGYNIRIINIFLLCVGISFFYGALYQAENYWDWKLLVNNLMVFSLPLAAYTFSDINLLSKVLSFWLRYSWIILLILIPFLGPDAFGRYLVPYSFLALFFMIVSKKYRILILVAYLITVILGYESRSDIIKYSVCLLIGCSFFIPFLRKLVLKYRKSIVCVLWGLPVFFFILGITGTFNIFRIEEELGLEGQYVMQSSMSGTEVSLLGDTRTGLYVEEIASAINNNYIMQGRSMARGYDSFIFGEGLSEVMHTLRWERQKSEVSILNIFNYFGLIGTCLYFLIFVMASYKAVAHSNNYYVPLIGIYVAFRWLFGWIEDFSRFDLNYLFLWVMIGICFSPQFRDMSNNGFKQWIYLVTK